MDIKTFRLVHVDVLFRSPLDATKCHVRQSQGYALDIGTYRGYIARVNNDATLSPLVYRDTSGFPLVTLTCTPWGMVIQLDTPLLKLDIYSKLVMYVTRAEIWTPPRYHGFAIFCFRMEVSQTNPVEMDKSILTHMGLIDDALCRYEPLCNNKV